LTRTILLTGAAGFIGSHVAQALLRRGDHVVAIDNFNDYYDPARKRANLQEARDAADGKGMLTVADGDIRDRGLLTRLFADYAFDAIIHLAAAAGVRNSINDPFLYVDVNVNGTLALLESAVGRLAPGAKRAAMPNFVFASTSSAYGRTKEIPFVETDPSNQPLAPYAATKRAGELFGHTYHHLYGLDFTVLRFFTVYGPRGRPDMMAYKVADGIRLGRAVPLFNNGQMHRDWTYVDDIAAGVLAAADRRLGHEIVNLGRGEPGLLADFVRLIEECAGARAKLVPGPMPDADVPYTYADISKARRLLGYDPKISVADGVKRFWEWYCSAVAGERTGQGVSQESGSRAPKAQ
jgi:UDP-glucuronate 4-epimerase